MVTKYVVDPDRRFQEAIQEALTRVRDLSLPLTLIAKDWFQANKAIFTLKGPGKYVDLSERYKERKQKQVGFVYPILKRSGLLEKSVTEPGNSNSINLILNKNTLVLGTKVKYAPYHQLGTKFLPIRPILFTGGEQAAPSEVYRRSQIWVMQLAKYALDSSQGVGKTDG